MICFGVTQARKMDEEAEFGVNIHGLDEKFIYKCI